MTTKRGAGRPKGSTKPDEERQKPHTIRMTDEEWRFCHSTGDASKYIRGLILIAKGQNEHPRPFRD